MEQHNRTDKFEIWVHNDVYKFLDYRQTFNNNFHRIIDLLKIHGRTYKTKNTKGVNGVWRRDGIGGNRGNQWYLWWTEEGPSIQVPVKDLSPLFIRDIRHHNEHSLLTQDKYIAQYTKVSHDNLLNSDSPPSLYLNQQQKDFIKSSAQIRTLHGNPGSGKTLTLYQSVSRLNKKVLYITWSSSLADAAKEYFRTVLSQDTDVKVLHFRELLEHITPLVKIPSFSLEAAVQYFKKQRREVSLGPWERNIATLLLELRAHKFGLIPNTIDLANNTTEKKSINTFEYNEIERRNFLEEKSIETLTRLLSWKGGLDGESLFPDLQGALNALCSLEMGKFPDTFRDFNAIVVDEIQDLTILEQKVIVQLARCIRDQPSGLQPIVWFAGDEGQTVNGSGFGWGKTNSLLLEFGRVAEFPLDSSPRFPNEIAEVLSKLKHYQSQQLGRSYRPGRQGKITGNSQTKADIMYVRISTHNEGKKLIENIIKLGGSRVAVIIPRERQSEEEDQIGNIQGVQTPVEVKGLEYQISCVVNMGRELHAVRQASERGSNESLGGMFSRYRFDRLRVAISRATNTLIVVDIEATDDEVQESLYLLDNRPESSADDVLRFLEEPDLDPEERLRSTLSGIAQYFGSNELVHQPLAWDGVRRSLNQLSELIRNYDVSDDSLRSLRSLRVETVDTAAKIALWLVTADTLHNDLNIHEIRETIRRELESDDHTVGRELEKDAFLAFCQWVENPAASPFKFLRCVEKFGVIPAWIADGINNKKQILRQSILEGATKKEQCLFYDGNISSWISISELNINTKNTLLKNSLQTLLNNNITDNLRGFLDKILTLDGCEDWILAGRVEYELECYAKAAEWFEKAEDWVRADDARLKANQLHPALLNALRIPGRKDQWLEELHRVREFVERMPVDGSQPTSSDLDDLQRVREFVEKMSFDGSQHTRPR